MKAKLIRLRNFIYRKEWGMNMEAQFPNPRAYFYEYTIFGYTFKRYFMSEWTLLGFKEIKWYNKIFKTK